MKAKCKKLGYGCDYRTKPKDLVEFPQEAYDIEELDQVGKLLKCCPYYHNKVSHVDADLVLIPYNFLLSKGMRDRMNIELRDAIIVIDEAHNITQAAES